VSGARWLGICVGVAIASCLLTLALERSLEWSPVGGGAAGGQNVACTLPHGGSAAPRGSPLAPVEICVAPVPISPGDDFLRSVLASVFGGLVGVATFTAGYIGARRRETKRVETATTLVIRELQANRSAMNEALNPVPPGGSPRLCTVSARIFQRMALEVGQPLPYEVVAQAFGVYARVSPLEGKDLRTVPAATVRRLRNDSQKLEIALAPYSKVV
jgi:hypothetical protein